MKRALLIDFDCTSGVRAGNIDPRDPNLQCFGWQDLQCIPAKEIRLVIDDRDLSQYDAADGVTVLLGIDVINKAITDFMSSTYYISDRELFFKCMEELKISFMSVGDLNDNNVLKKLFTDGVLGIQKKIISLVTED